MSLIKSSAAQWPKQRWPLYALLLWGVSLPWQAKHLPLVDLPQHAAQAALLRDLIMGDSPWSALVQTHLFSPYLFAYGTAAWLSLWMPIHSAFALLLSAALIGFFVACVELRKQFGGDARLDGYFLPSFFGFAWKWGFISYLIAAPIGLGFILCAYHYARLGGRWRGLCLAVLGGMLFFCHALIFLFAVLIGTLFLINQRGLVAAWRYIAPYLVFLVLAVVYQRHAAGLVIDNATTAAVVWGDGYERLLSGLVYSWDFIRTLPSTSYYAASTALMLSVPWLLGARLNLGQRAAWIPWATVCFIFLAVPAYAFKTWFLYQRFALFILPFYALLFKPVELTEVPAKPGKIDFKRMRAGLGQAVLFLICAVFFYKTTTHIRAFDQETQDINQLIEQIPPAQRLLNLTPESYSVAAANPITYVHYAGWYQAERQGWVDVNFAVYGFAVLFKPEHLPKVVHDFEWFPKRFNWQVHQGWIYDYFIVRNIDHAADDLIAALFDNGDCQIAPFAHAGEWWVFQRRDCVVAH